MTTQNRKWVQIQAPAGNWNSVLGTADDKLAKDYMKKSIADGEKARIVRIHTELLDAGNSFAHTDCMNGCSYAIAFDSSSRPILKIYLGETLLDELYLPTLPTQANSVTTQALWKAWADAIKGE